MADSAIRRAARVLAAAVILAGPVGKITPAAAEKVLRIAMTAGDLPDWAGQPDQGFEGYRFVGYNLYDGLVNWDLSHSDQEADLRPGLATKWYPDATDPKRWIFELRHDVKFHDGCPWNADEALWNIERLTSDKSPSFSPVNFARARSRTSTGGITGSKPCSRSFSIAQRTSASSSITSSPLR